MTKTRRQMAEYIKQVDAVCEVVDARIPQVSRNPDMDEIAAGKPRMMILNRIDLADPNMTAVWAKHFREQGMAVIQTDSRSGNGTQAFSGAVRTLLADKIAQWNEKGLVGKSVRVMVVGIPNVGKSTFINRILGRKSAKAADRPGVTRGSQWFRVESGIDLLDTPGILWPKFDDERVGILLACTGAIKDDILDVETLGCKLMELLAEQAPQTIIDRYSIAIPEEECDFLGYELLQQAGVKTIHEISRCKDYEEYQTMSQANFNLVLHPEARFAAEDFHDRLKIPFIELRRLYQTDKIENQYRALGQVLGVSFDQEVYKKAAEEAVERFREVCPDASFAVGECMNGDPFELALALVRYGFRVPEIYGTITAENFVYIRHLAELSPDTKVFSNMEPTMLYYDPSGSGVNLTIGKDAGYYHRDQPNAVWNQDRQPYGYAGVRRLFETLTEKVLQKGENV